jgi:hypothetical protein
VVLKVHHQIGHREARNTAGDGHRGAGLEREALGRRSLRWRRQRRSFGRKTVAVRPIRLQKHKNLVFRLVEVFKRLVCGEIAFVQGHLIDIGPVGALDYVNDVPDRLPAVHVPQLVARGARDRVFHEDPHH